MSTHRRYEKGFLALVSVLVVVVVAIILVASSYQFTQDSVSSTNHLKSSQAFYLAAAGISAGKSAVAGGASCATYSSGNVSLGQGQYNVTGAANLRSATLNGAITASSTTIPLSSTVGFTSSGVISIDSEFITYGSISGNSLLGASRGLSGTVAAAHNSGAAVAQNECILTSNGGVPTLASPMGKRTLQMVLPGVGFALGTSGGGAGGFVIPALVATQQINISGGSITNPTVTTTSPSYTNSTALSNANIVMNNPGVTQINTSGGSLTTASSPGNLQSDVGQNSSLFNSGNLFSKFFTQSQAVIQAGANQTYTQATINGVTGQTIWFNGTLSISGNVTIGSPTSPVILIMSNSNLLMSGNATIYGFVYINPNFSLSMQGNSRIEGAVAVNGPVNMNSGGGAPNITLNPTILGLLNITNNNTTNKYSGDPISLQEVFP